MFNFCGPDRLRELLAKAGLQTNYVTAFSTLEELQQMAEAACSVQFCDTLSSYVTTVLEERYNVVKIRNAPPFGITWTDEWLQEIGRVTGHEEEIRRVIEEEHKRIEPELDNYREILRGKRVFIMTGDQFAYQLANAARDLQMEVVGIASLHHDQVPDGSDEYGALDKYRKDHGNAEKVHVCAKQPHQAVKLIREAQPDLLICRHPGVENAAMRLGIPVLPEGDKNFSIAYDGLVKLGKRAVRALRTRRVIEHLAAHTKLPYTDWWLNADTDPQYFEQSGR